jgi:hypothetical protein
VTDTARPSVHPCSAASRSASRPTCERFRSLRSSLQVKDFTASAQSAEQWITVNQTTSNVKLASTFRPFNNIETFRSRCAISTSPHENVSQPKCDGATRITQAHSLPLPDRLSGLQVAAARRSRKANAYGLLRPRGCKAHLILKCGCAETLVWVYGYVSSMEFDRIAPKFPVIDGRR